MTSLYGINYQLKAHKRDPFIEFIKSLLLTPFMLNQSSQSSLSDIFFNIELLVNDHIQHCLQGTAALSRLHQLVPSIGLFFTSLPLRDAFIHVDLTRSISSRTVVPPSFNDIRHILNYAQILAIRSTLKLITFDGDQTLYSDGADFSHDSELVDLIISLLSHNVYVAVVTAAGYGHDNTRYEQRLRGLLDGIKSSSLSSSQKQNFYVMGGECNFLFKYNNDRLEYISQETYQTPDVQQWSQDQQGITKLLDVAQECINDGIKRMGLDNRITVIRKEKAVGLILKSGASLSREQLDEFALSVQKRLNDYQTIENLKGHFQFPFCCFNGGSDVWVDIGNKLIGVKCLQDYLGCAGNQTLHVGDQFLSTGNDYSTRCICSTIWITNPQETSQILKELKETW